MYKIVPIYDVTLGQCFVLLKKKIFGWSEITIRKDKESLEKIVKHLEAGTSYC